MNILATIGLGLFAGIGFGCVIGRCCYMNRSVERQIHQRMDDILGDACAQMNAECRWPNPEDLIHEDYDVEAGCDNWKDWEGVA